MNDYPLGMTAAVDPKGMDGISVTNVAERAGQYIRKFLTKNLKEIK